VQKGGGCVYLEGTPDLSAERMADTNGQQVRFSLGAEMAPLNHQPETVRGRQAWFPDRGVAGPSFLQLAPGIVLLGGSPQTVHDAVQSLDLGKEPTCDPRMLPLLPKTRPQVFVATTDDVLLESVQSILGDQDKVEFVALAVSLDVSPMLRLHVELRPAQGTEIDVAVATVTAALQRIAEDWKSKEFLVEADLIGRATCGSTGEAVTVDLQFDERETALRTSMLGTAVQAFFLMNQNRAVAERQRAREMALQAARAAFEEQRRQAEEAKKKERLKDNDRDER
jgi:hypothetical protein